jgi:hypothetical protein
MKETFTLENWESASIREAMRIWPPALIGKGTSGHMTRILGPSFTRILLHEVLQEEFGRNLRQASFRPVFS